MTYAFCYYSAQGQTIKGRHLALFDTGNRHFTVRHLIVGMSRVTHGDFLSILTPEQEQDYAQVWRK